MLGFLILLGVMFTLWVLLLGMADTSEISKNWPKYRCEPTVMPFASFFGHDTNENFDFCLKNIMNSNLKTVFSPIFTILGTFLGTIGNLMNMANSMRLEFATFMGGINTVLQNFMDRFNQLLTNVRVAAMRMRMLFGRLYATFFAVIYMATSGTMAMQNFGETLLFRFIDTFCFAPETQVLIEGKGSIAVQDVCIGDTFQKTGGKVTSLFKFMADGQPMVVLPGEIEVSTNHYVSYNGSYLKAVDHPQAKKTGFWTGGKERPLICFNTSDHKIPIGDFLFLDYDETEKGDQLTMAWADAKMNGKATPAFRTYNFDYTTVFDPKQRVRVLDDLSAKEAKNVDLGARLSTGEVIGIVYKEVQEICILPTGECVTPGSSVWDFKTNQWRRAGDMYVMRKLSQPALYMNFIVRNTAAVEFASGRMMRDYVEIHSPDAEQFYAKAIEAL